VHEISFCSLALPYKEAGTDIVFNSFFSDNCDNIKDLTIIIIKEANLYAASFITFLQYR
jgi:hypothetical protein